MHSNCIKKLLGLEDVILKKVIQSDNYVKLFIETTPSPQICPCCGRPTSRIHDTSKASEKQNRYMPLPLIVSLLYPLKIHPSKC